MPLCEMPKYSDLIQPTFHALRILGDSGTVAEIEDQVVVILDLSDEVVDRLHGDSSSRSELSYRLAWARTYLKKFGAIDNSTRGVWVICPEYSKCESIDSEKVIAFVRESAVADKETNFETAPRQRSLESPDDLDEYVELSEEIKPWRNELSQLLKTMNPYAFERLAKRLMRECGFEDVRVTKKSGDGGIDGTCKLLIAGIFSQNIAFQCKRYSETVGSKEIRDFRGALTTDIERAVMITTGRFSKEAESEASMAGKLRIDLLDGEGLITKLEELELGLKQVTAYKIVDGFFETI